MTLGKPRTLGVVAIVVGVAAIGGGESGATDVIARVEPSTVLVVSDNGDGSGERGTGWVWDAGRGLVVTNAHVTAGARKWTVATGRKIEIQPDESGALSAGPDAIPAELVGAARCEDIAVLEVRDSSSLKTIEQLPAGEDLEGGDRVVAVGYPASLTASDDPALGAALTGDGGAVTRPHTTFPAIRATGPYGDVLETSAAINRGNSGGPLINFRGELVGMSTARNNENVGQSYAIAIRRIRAIVPRLIAGENVCGTTGGE